MIFLFFRPTPVSAIKPFIFLKSKRINILRSSVLYSKNVHNYGRVQNFTYILSSIVEKIENEIFSWLDRSSSVRHTKRSNQASKRLKHSVSKKSSSNALFRDKMKVKELIFICTFVSVSRCARKAFLDLIGFICFFISVCHTAAHLKCV